MKQNKTKLQFMLGASLLLALTFTACNGSGETKEATKDTPVLTPPVVVKDSVDTPMEKIPGNVAPGSDVKPQ